MLRVSDLQLLPGETDVQAAVAKRINVDREDILHVNLVKKSLDARKKSAPVWMMVVDVEVASSAMDKIMEDKGISLAPATEEDFFQGITTKHFPKRPVIIGSGPAGLFAALYLAKQGAKPIIVERGQMVEIRQKDVDAFWKTGELCTNSNVQFGEGGAGTFSDGKLNTGTKSPLQRPILQALVENGAPEEILYMAHPHVGTDKLRSVVKNLRNSITHLGGEFLFDTLMTDFTIKDGAVQAVLVQHHGETREISTDTLILAIGHSSRDTFEMLYRRGVYLLQKPFSVGVRIEHPRRMIDKRQFGDAYDKLPAAEYKLSHHTKSGRGVYTFCVCPGGEVIAAASEEGGVVTNGMSNYCRDKENTNSAVLVSVLPEDFSDAHPLAGIAFARQIEKAAFAAAGGTYRATSQRVGDFLKGQSSTEAGSVKPTYLPSVNMGDFAAILPPFVIEGMKEGLLAFENKVKGFAMEDAILTGPETRSSSPVRIPRDENFTSNIKGLYPCGEGSGYAGGIMSSAVDGIKCAMAAGK